MSSNFDFITPILRWFYPEQQTKLNFSVGQLFQGEIMWGEHFENARIWRVFVYQNKENYVAKIDWYASVKKVIPFIVHFTLLACYICLNAPIVCITFIYYTEGMRSRKVFERHSYAHSSYSSSSNAGWYHENCSHFWVWLMIRACIWSALVSLSAANLCECAHQCNATPSICILSVIQTVKQNKCVLFNFMQSDANYYWTITNIIALI